MNSNSQSTRAVLMEVARELFAKYGKNNVTMNRIALASGKGRRTLYTYFNSKDEIYKAVVDNELDFCLQKLLAVSEQQIDPITKLSNFIISHLDTVREAVQRNGTLRADFFHDIYEVERTRRKIDLKELIIISQILEEGVKSSVFKPMDNLNLSAVIILYSLKGIEIPYMRLVSSLEFEQSKKTIVDFILSSIRTK